MKKLLRLNFLLVIILLMSPLMIHAITNVFNINLVITNDELETTGYIYMNINIDASYNLKAFDVVLDYDKAKLELIEVNEEDKFDISNNIDYSTNKLYVSGVYNKGKTGQFTVASLIFKKTQSFVAGDTVKISLQEVNGSDDTKGIGNSINVNIPGVMEIKHIFIDNHDVIDTKKYTTIADKVNISADVLYGEVLSGTGEITLDYGVNNHVIKFKDQRGQEESITLVITRNKKSSTVNSDNGKDSRVGNINTGDNIIKAFIIAGISLIGIIVCDKVLMKEKKS